MILSLITNDPEVAHRAEQAGVERILIDLERRGKAARQLGRSLFLSTHEMKDVRRVRDALRQSSVAVRVDSLHAGSQQQIDAVIAGGADFIVLPFFERFEHAAEFVAALGGRAQPILLVESASAAEMVGDLCRLPGVAEIHIGLNDLSISLGLRAWSELIGSSVLQMLCATLRAARVPFGFGGIACLSRRDLPFAPELVLAEQVCQGATRGWLSRAFREAALDNVVEEVRRIREAIAFWRSVDAGALAEVRSALSIEFHRQAKHANSMRSRAALSAHG
jgi:hypothetical protein